LRNDRTFGTDLGRAASIRMKLAILAASLILSLLFAELALRLFYPQPVRGERGGYSPVSGTRYYLLRPNFHEIVHDRISTYAFSTNSYGIRDVEFDPSISHPRRVLFLGDSLTEGVGVDLESTFVKQFEAQIKTRTRKDWQALNLALAGGSTFDEVYAYEVKGAPLSHKYVVLGFYVGNDFSDNLHFQERPVSNGQATSLYTTRQKIIRALAFHSQLWSFAATRLRSPLFYRWGMLSYSDTFLAYAKKNESSQVQYAWDLTFMALQDLEDDVKNQHARLILLLIPQEIQVGQGVFDKTLRLHGWNPADYDRTRPQQILKAFADRNGIWTLDLLNWFNKDDYYYLADHTHFNKLGHTRAAEALTEVFERIEESSTQGGDRNR
jgi:lysophospholipase L1-like esterase